MKAETIFEKLWEQYAGENPGAGQIHKLFVDAGVMVLTSFISPFIQDRRSVRNIVNETEFIEIYVKCPLEVCEQRDVKGLYKRARKGEIKHFTGIDSAYEEPEKADIVIDTSVMSIDESVNTIINYMIKHSYIVLTRKKKLGKLLLDSFRAPQSQSI